VKTEPTLNFAPDNSHTATACQGTKSSTFDLWNLLFYMGKFLTFWGYLPSLLVNVVRFLSGPVNKFLFRPSLSFSQTLPKVLTECIKLSGAKVENIKTRYRQFGTLDAVSVLALVAIVASVSGAILSEMLRDERPMRARSTAEALAHQLVSPPAPSILEASQIGKSEKGDRSPASVSPAMTSTLREGDIGKDPWGRPFHYWVRPGAQRLVIVWSDGPNGVPESGQALKLAAETASQEKVSQTDLRFQGDDLGYIETRGR
jgi:hypothetical protein